MSLTAKELAKTADLFLKAQERRLKMQKKVDELKEDESKYRDALLANMAQSGLSVVGGKYCSVERKIKSVAKITNRDDLRKYVKRTGDIDVFQNRLSDPHIRELWDDEQVVPGVGTEQIATLSVHRVKS